jgi:CheY-like chemotaxis protein
MSANILVIEDDELLSRILSHIVVVSGHLPFIALNGGAALELLKVQHVDLILLDLYMPGMNGWVFLQEYEKFPLPLAPVVIITTGSSEMPPPDDIPLIKKPFKTQQILDAISEALH